MAETRQLWLVILLGVCAVGVAFSLVVLSDLKAEIGSMTPTVVSTPSEVDVTTYTTTWNSAEGQQEVKTTRGEGPGVPANETAAQHAARHKAAVTALQEQFPKID